VQEEGSALHTALHNGAAQEERWARQTAAICPFLEGPAAGTNGESVANAASLEGSCGALGVPLPLARRQLELACLRSAHVTCPRYVHAVANPQAHPAAGRIGPSEVHRLQAGVRTRPRVRQPIVAAGLVLILSAGIAAGYLVSGGALKVPSSSPALVAAASPSPSAAASPEPSPSPSLETSPPSSPSSSPLPSPSTSPIASPSPTGGVEALFPKGGRWDHLAPCPDVPDCYIYTVQAGDTLYAISGTFNVPIKTILDLNPRITNSKVVHVGQKIRLPTPTP
jgi:hypothetical protein